MTKDLTHGNPLKVILLFVYPLILGNLFQQFYSLTDTIIVGRFVGLSALAAVGSTGSVSYLMLGFVIGVCNGFAIPIAQCFGARDEEGLRRHVANAVWLCAGMAAVLTVATVLLTRPILLLMRTPADILDDAAAYIGWIFAGIPFVFLYNMVACIMRALGDSKTPLYFLLLTSGLNVVLDLLLVLVFHQGVFGAALATDVSQAISGALSLGYLVRRFAILKMRAGDWSFRQAVAARLCGMGIPMGLQCTITAVGAVVMQGAVNGLGSTAVAAVTASGKTSGLLGVAFDSLGTAVATYTGQNLGARRLDRVRSGVRYALGVSTVYAALCAAVIRLIDVPVIGLFIDTRAEAEVVTLARTYLHWNVWFFAVLGLLILYRYAIQGMGYSGLAMIAGVAEMVARIGVALVLVPLFGFYGACLSNPAAWAAACVFLLPAYRWTVKHLANRMQADQLHSTPAKTDPGAHAI